MAEIYEETDSRLVQLEKLRAHVLRLMRGWRPENFSTPELYQERVAFGERCVGNLERAIAREVFEAAAIESMARVEEFNDQFRQPNPRGRYPLCKPMLRNIGVCESCGGVPGNHPCPAVPPEHRWGEDYVEG